MKLFRHHLSLPCLLDGLGLVLLAATVLALLQPQLLPPDISTGLPWIMLTAIVSLAVTRLYLARQLRAITHILAQAEVAQHSAEEAVKTKARFLATMSHEIRTPMNGVIGMTRLLMNTPMSKKQSEFVESIHLSGEHLLTVINDVLDFSKIEAGKLDLKREPFDLRACIEDIISLLHAKALEKNLELAYTVGPSIPLFIEGDQVRLRQILTNLVGNAIKFTDRGEITIFVLPRRHKGDEYELEFQINDTGPGIPANRLESIFEQFSRADDKLVRQREGTGLGLAISRHLIDMMGGRIWVQSTVGVGSRFHFTVKTRKAKGQLKPRSEERRVGKECRRLCRSRWSPYH
jgi:signal transduction histidine kinase